jgi:hypothetical protein
MDDAADHIGEAFDDLGVVAERRHGGKSGRAMHAELDRITQRL